MNVDLEYDYAEAMKRQGHMQADVDALRSALQEVPVVPKSITNKQVRDCQIFSTGNRLTFFYYPSASSLFGRLRWRRRWRKSRKDLLHNKEEFAGAFRQPRPPEPENPAMP